MQLKPNRELMYAIIDDNFDMAWDGLVHALEVIFLDASDDREEYVIISDGKFVPELLDVLTEEFNVPEDGIFINMLARYITDSAADPEWRERMGLSYKEPDIILNLETYVKTCRP